MLCKVTHCINVPFYFTHSQFCSTKLTIFPNLKSSKSKPNELHDNWRWINSGTATGTQPGPHYWRGGGNARFQRFAHALNRHRISCPPLYFRTSNLILETVCRVAYTVIWCTKYSLSHAHPVATILLIWCFKWKLQDLIESDSVDQK